MSFASIGIKTTIPATALAATSGAVTFSSIDPVNWLQVTGAASAGSGSLYLLRWNADLEEWRPYQEDKPIAVDSSKLGGLFSGFYPFPAGEESFVLYDPAAVITATASAARTSSPLAAPTSNAQLASLDAKLPALGQHTAAGSLSVTFASDIPALAVAVSSPLPAGTAHIGSVEVDACALPTGASTSAKQDTGNSSLASILGQLDNKTSTLATASAQSTGNTSLSTIASRLAPATYQVVDTATTAIISGSTCTLLKVYWAAGGSGASLALYDSAGGLTNQFFSQLTSAVGQIDFGPTGMTLVNGLIAVASAATPPAFITIVYR